MVVQVPGLGARKPLQALSKKRVTKALRALLRRAYGFGNVIVSCSAVWNGQAWDVAASINGYRGVCHVI